MARIKKSKVRWNASSTSGVKGYRLYWAVDGAVSYSSDFKELGNVTEITLPDDVSGFPLVKGHVEFGLTAVDEAGNESDITRLSATVNFVAPDSPMNPSIESTEDYHITEVIEETAQNDLVAEEEGASYSAD
jgi:hypothetical protein